MRHNVRALVEGAVTAAIYIIFLLLATYTPIGLLLYLILPLPFTIYTTRHSWKNSILLGFACVLLTIPLGLLLLFPMIIFSWAVGLVLGISFAKKQPALQTIVWGTLATLAFLLASLFAANFIMNVNVIDEMIDLIKESFAESEAILQSLLPSETASNQEIMDLFIQQIELRFPSILILNAILIGFLNYWFAYLLHKRLWGHPTPFPPLSDIRFPKSLLYYYLVVFLLFLWPGIQEINWLYLSVINIYPILELAMAVQGVLFVFYYAKVKGMGKGLPITCLVLLFIPPFPYILRLIGIVDLGFNLREKLSPRS